MAGRRQVRGKGKPAPPPTGGADGSPPATRDVRPPAVDPPPFPAVPAPPPAPVTALRVEVVLGDVAREDVPVVVLGRMERGPATGALRQFDQRLKGWLSHAVE